MIEKKGGAAACPLCINRNTRRVRRDMHANGICERFRQAITEAEKKMSPTFTTTCVRVMERRVDSDRALSLI